MIYIMNYIKQEYVTGLEGICVHHIIYRMCMMMHAPIQPLHNKMTNNQHQRMLLSSFTDNMLLLFSLIENMK